tara:strand:- start:293 stop:460 length:168 start_codon:yes stop_codon:yes gene_type:complete
MGICLCLMPANIEGREMLKQKEINESSDDAYSLLALDDQSESEIKWVELHQMFDR